MGVGKSGFLRQSDSYNVLDHLHIYTHQSPKHMQVFGPTPFADFTRFRVSKAIAMNKAGSIYELGSNSRKFIFSFHEKNSSMSFRDGYSPWVQVFSRGFGISHVSRVRFTEFRVAQRRHQFGAAPLAPKAETSIQRPLLLLRQNHSQQSWDSGFEVLSLTIIQYSRDFVLRRCSAILPRRRDHWS